MLINIDVLISYGGNIKKVKKGDIIFFEEEQPKYFYQIIEGEIKMFNENENGKEFTQGLFSSGNSFGEPPLFLNVPYPATAIALKDGVIVRLLKGNFTKLLEDYPAFQNKLLTEFARRIYGKANSFRAIINNPPEKRILGVLNSIKNENEDKNEKQLINLTRQEIANLSGLRVETVIRTLKEMARKNMVSIINHKIYY